MPRLVLRPELPRAAVLLGLVLGAPVGAEPPGRSAVPSYTDADLERVRPLRHETGVLSEPAFRGPAQACAPEPPERPSGRGRRRARATSACDSDERRASGEARDGRDEA